MIEKKYTDFLNDLKAVCKKHNMCLVGTCDSEGIWSEIDLVPKDKINTYFKNGIQKEREFVQLIEPSENAIITECEVQSKNDTQIWIITKNDNDPSTIGLPTASGLPSRAKDLPIGAKYTTILTFPTHSSSSKIQMNIKLL